MKRFLCALCLLLLLASSSWAWPPRAGDIFCLVSSDGWLNQQILSVEARYDPDGNTRIVHVGIILNDDGQTLETTAGRTSLLDLAKTYAGSNIIILRWSGMTPERAQLGFNAVAHQLGRPYPVGRLLTAWLGIPGHLAKASAMECDVLGASYLVGAGAPLPRDPWDYLPETLYDELRQSPDWSVVFSGSMRAAGLVTGSGPDNRLVLED